MTYLFDNEAVTARILIRPAWVSRGRV